MGDPFGDPLKLDKIGFSAVFVVFETLRPCLNSSRRCRSSSSGNSSHRAFIRSAASRVSTSAFAAPQKATSSGIKILPEIGAACLSDSAAQCRCPKPALKLWKSERAFLRASTQHPHAQLVGRQRQNNRLQRQHPPPKPSGRSWICGWNTEWKTTTG